MKEILARGADRLALEEETATADPPVAHGYVCRGANYGDPAVPGKRRKRHAERADLGALVRDALARDGRCFVERFALPVESQWTWKENRTLTRCPALARLKQPASLENVDSRYQHGLDRGVSWAWRMSRPR